MKMLLSCSNGHRNTLNIVLSVKLQYMRNCERLVFNVLKSKYEIVKEKEGRKEE
jgi:hypothetical protein